jgi:hypothetical protein
VIVASCFEAGRDGFWMHRLLIAHGVANHVMEPTSILVNRRARRARPIGSTPRSAVCWSPTAEEITTSAVSSGYRALRRKTPSVNTVSANIWFRKGSVSETGFRRCWLPRASENDYRYDLGIAI